MGYVMNRRSTFALNHFVVHGLHWKSKFWHPSFGGLEVIKSQETPIDSDL